ncbi:MAG: transcriptional regulator GlxA family with amidase domain [Oleiphilaceae bacterium]
MAQSTLKAFGVESRINERIVRSGKIVTAAGIDLALHIVKDLHGQERAEVSQLLIEYDPMPSVDAGHPSKASKEAYKKAKAEAIRNSNNLKNVISIPHILWRIAIQKT